MMQYRKYENEM